MDRPCLVIRRHYAKPIAAMSSGECSGEVAPPDVMAGRPFDMDRFRTVFPDIWADFLRSHFRDKEHIAYFFDTDERTARNWLSGLNAPTGPRAVAAVLRFPDLRQRLLEAVAA